MLCEEEQYKATVECRIKLFKKKNVIIIVNVAVCDREETQQIFSEQWKRTGVLHI